MADEPNGSIEVVAPTQILVEGKDDLSFFDEFIKHALDEEIRNNIQIHSYGGNTELEEYLLSLEMAQGPIAIQSVGIVRDADENEASAFQSLRDALESTDLNWPIPDEVNVPAQGTPSVTTIILPGGGRPGALETLLCDTLTDELTFCVDEYFKCAERWTESARLQNIAQRDKGRARVYIAAQKRPHLSLGFSFKDKYWDFEHPAFGIVRRFLEVVSDASGFPLARE
ncbi:MAG: hypothetical protein OXT69_01835 [Candidatus Poribacteria bacterium]|nr:hypothetical protein [Candidatus Poribacteria bacterium]